MFMPSVINPTFKMPYNLVIRKTLDSIKTVVSSCIQNLAMSLFFPDCKEKEAIEKESNHE